MGLWMVVVVLCLLMTVVVSGVGGLVSLCRLKATGLM